MPPSDTPEADVPDAGKESVLEGRRLAYAYPGGARVVTETTLSLRPASLNALIGANGSGKSTLLKLLAGLIAPSAGSVHLGGRPLGCLSRRELARVVAYVPQNHDMVFPFTALEVVLTGRTPHGSAFCFENENDLAIARRALEAVDAGALAERAVTTLSGGERQLVAVARALAQEPSILLLDEPSASLDLRHRAGLVRLLVELRASRGLASLVVTHDLEMLDPEFDEVFALLGGNIVARGAPAQVLCPSVLGAVFQDTRIRTLRRDNRTFVWSE